MGQSILPRSPLDLFPFKPSIPNSLPLAERHLLDRVLHFSIRRFEHQMIIPQARVHEVGASSECSGEDIGVGVQVGCDPTSSRVSADTRAGSDTVPSDVVLV